MHISELAQHHVENPREIVSQGDKVNVRILEIDAEQAAPLALAQAGRGGDARAADAVGEEAEPPALGLSDEVFADEVPAAEALEVPEAPAEEPVAETEVLEEEPIVEVEAIEEEPAADEAAVEEEPAAEAELEA